MNQIEEVKAVQIENDNRISETISNNLHLLYSQNNLMSFASKKSNAVMM